ncbi:MAG: hypothetical protein MK165_08510 [Pirellulaceae bacterium]|nr:hypothetical protein [Pirellulaceae bacterium]
MKRITVLLLTILISFPVFADPIKVAETDVTFAPPDGFKALPQEIIDLKWPNKRAPKFVVGNDNASTTVAYDIKPNNLPQKDLVDAQKVFTDIFEKIVPDIEWEKNEIIEHSGQKWLLMEMTSRAIDTNIYNIMFATGYKGQMLMFNFNSTKEDFPKYEKQLRASLKSVQLPK